MKTTIAQRWEILRSKMLRQREILAKQGSLASRLASGRRVWSVRFFVTAENGQRVQRTIYLGTEPAILAQATAYLQEIREMRRMTRELELLTKVLRRVRKCSQILIAG